MKSTSFIAGCFVTGVAIVTLLMNFGEHSFTVHMVVHMTIVALAAPLLAYGVTDKSLAISQAPTWLTPVLASFLEMVVVWFWHVPAIRRSAEASLDIALLEALAFLVAGLLLWFACLRSGVNGAGRLAGIIGLLFTSMHMTLLGVLLALSPRPLYVEGTVTCFGIELSGPADQQIGGIVMLMVGALVYLMGGIGLLLGILRSGLPDDARRPQC